MDIVIQKFVEDFEENEEGNYDDGASNEDDPESKLDEEEEGQDEGLAQTARWRCLRLRANAR